LSQDLPRRLLQMILADPDDDVARMVYADWLAEQGDPARGDLVRLQLASARLPAWDPERLRLELRERALLSEHEARWRAELPRMRALKAHLETCCRATPLQGVALRWAPFGEWAELPAFPGLRELTLYGPLLHPTDVDGLAQSPWLASVRALDIIESGLEQEALQHLLASPHLGQLAALRLPHHLLRTVIDLVKTPRLHALRELDLSVPTVEELGSGGRDHATLGAADLKRLAAWPGLARLRSLDLSGHLFGAAGLKALLSSPHVVGLKELHLRQISPKAAFAFDAFAKPHPGLSLEVLSLQDNFDAAGAGKLADSPCLSELKVLNLHQAVEQEPGALYDVVQAPWFDSLHVLDVPYGEALPLLEALPARAPANLHTLKLEGSLSGSPPLPALRKLADSPASDGLLHLDLSFNSLHEAALQTLAEARGLQSLQALRLRDHCNASPKAVERLEASPLGRRLVSFEIGQNTPAHQRLPRPTPRPLPTGAYRGPLRYL
jgi:uncharacterized protein (TIGR02996 family)